MLRGNCCTVLGLYYFALLLFKYCAVLGLIIVLCLCQVGCIFLLNARAHYYAVLDGVIADPDTCWGVSLLVLFRSILLQQSF